MMPPTWRELKARARAKGLRIVHGRHQATVCRGAEVRAGFASWTSRRGDRIILRTAVAAALEQLEARR